MARIRGKLRLMRGGAVEACPPGFHCMDTSTLLLWICIGLLVVGVVVFLVRHTVRDVSPSMQAHAMKPTVVVVESPRPAVVAPTAQAQHLQVDHRFQPSAPEKEYDGVPDLRGFPTSARDGVPIQIPTRGIPEEFQQIGVLTAPGGTETSASPTRTILPLFGRKLITNRDRWNYYTRTDGINPVQVPIQFKRRNCDEDLGCDEIMDGDSIGVPILGQSYVASVYRNRTPRYIPYV